MSEVDVSQMEIAFRTDTLSNEKEKLRKRLAEIVFEEKSLQRMCDHVFVMGRCMNCRAESGARPVR